MNIPVNLMCSFTLISLKNKINKLNNTFRVVDRIYKTCRSQDECEV